MQGILLQIGYFERGLSKRFKKVNFIFLSNHMLSDVTRMYLYVMRMSLVCTCKSFVCHSYALVCHPYVTRITRMLSVYHSYVLLCHPCVTLCGFTMNPSFPLIFISGNHRVTTVTMNKVFDLFGFLFHYLSVQNNNCTPSTLCILVTINLCYDIIRHSLLY